MYTQLKQLKLLVRNAFSLKYLIIGIDRLLDFAVKIPAMFLHNDVYWKMQGPLPNAGDIPAFFRMIKIIRWQIMQQC